jgi:hypothetical protein
MSDIDNQVNVQSLPEHNTGIAGVHNSQALDILKQVGLLVPVCDVETYHGRVGRKTDEREWQVDPNFSNGGHDDGFYNVNIRTTLYTGDRETARDFARNRAREEARLMYKKLFAGLVVTYGPEQKLDWLHRVNKERLERSQHEPCRVVTNLRTGKSAIVQSASGPERTFVPVTEADLGDGDVRREAERLQKEATPELKDAYWKLASEGLKVEVHEIVPVYSDATVLDLSFDSTKLSDEDKAKYEKALLELLIPITDGLPVERSSGDEFQRFSEVVKRMRKSFVSIEDAATIVADSGLGKATVDQFVGAHNARQIAAINPSELVEELIKSRQGAAIYTFEVDGEKHKAPLNLKYAERYLRLLRIVGVKQSIASRSLRRDVTSVSFIDLERIRTAMPHESESRRTSS